MNGLGAIPGGWELFVVLMVVLLLFGSTKLPKLARSLGASVTEFKKGVKGGGEDEKVGEQIGDAANLNEEASSDASKTPSKD